ncbi:MAG: adenylate/guanylate cyclase domain-containing protein, partial [Stappiaceae bacterium]
MENTKPERRLAAILAADVVGYSRMMGEDETGTLMRLKAFERNIIAPAVDEHSGRIIKRMGDGYIVQFQSVISAIECAIAWQGAAGDPITFRIGVNLGDVIVEDNDLFGEGVNVAARLEAIADPGGIYISEDVWRQSRGKISAQFEDLGEKKLKNISEPLRVYRVVSDDPASFNAHLKRPNDDVQFSWKIPTVLLSPFRQLGAGGDAESVASGLTETLAAALAHFEEFKTIDPGSAALAISDLGALGAGRRLGVDFLLEGSVQTSGRKARIGVQLIDIASGSRVWSDTLDHSLEDVFELQDDITALVAST